MKKPLLSVFIVAAIVFMAMPTRTMAYDFYAYSDDPIGSQKLFFRIVDQGKVVVTYEQYNGANGPHYSSENIVQRACPLHGSSNRLGTEHPPEKEHSAPQIKSPDEATFASESAQKVVCCT